jgi:hypothetical protein
MSWRNSVCESVCYAGKLEKVFPTVKKNLLHNWELLKNADHDTMEALLTEMIEEFIADCDGSTLFLIILTFSSGFIPV